MITLARRAGRPARIDLVSSPPGRQAGLSTDSYVIDPLFFPGGDIGKLAVCGTANDVAVMVPFRATSPCGFILEEGLPMETLAAGGQQHGAHRARGRDCYRHRRYQGGSAARRISSLSTPPGWGRSPIFTGARSTGRGRRAAGQRHAGLSRATILNLREGLGLDGELRSDCAVLTPAYPDAAGDPGVKALRDATRGGVNAVVHEFAACCGCGIELTERSLPVKPAVRGLCELLGLIRSILLMKASW